MPNPKTDQAFTLIELIVVISLIGIILVFSIPRFHAAVLSDPNRQVSLWLTETIHNLKETSIRHGRRYIMHIDIDSGKCWVTHSAMTEDEGLAAQTESFSFPDGIGIVDVEFPRIGKVSNGEVEIFFYESGYSDKALLHMESIESGFKTYLIEPFLQQTKVFDTYWEFEN